MLITQTSEPRAAISVSRFVLIAMALGLLLTGCGDNTTTVIRERTVTGTGTGTGTASQGTTSNPANASVSVIEIQRGIGSARLGMSQAEVTQSLGAPQRTYVESKATPPRTQFDYTIFVYPNGVSVGFPRGGSMSDRAAGFTVGGTGALTPEGIGVGSSEGDIRARIPDTTCDNSFGEHACYVGQRKAGATVTVFRLKAGRVTSIKVELLEPL